MNYGFYFQKLIDESDVNTVLTNNLEGKLRTYESLLLRVLFNKDILLLIFEYIEINYVKSLKLVCKMWRDTVEDKRYLSFCIMRRIPKEFSAYKELYDWKMYYNKLCNRYELGWLTSLHCKPNCDYDESLEFFCSYKKIYVGNFIFYFDEQNKLTFLICSDRIVKGCDHIKSITFTCKKDVMNPGIIVSKVSYERDGIYWEGQVYGNPKTYHDIVPHGSGFWKFPGGSVFQGKNVAFCGIPHGIGINGDQFWLGSRIHDDSRKLIKIPINF